MSTIRSLLPALILPVMLVAGCTGAAPAAAQLDGRTFLSTKITSKGADRPLVPGTSIRITFDKNGQLGLNAGCNHMGGTYRLQGNVLVVEGGAMTEMGCDEPRHKQDDWVFGLLGSKPTIALSGNDLTITAGDTVIRLLDREIADPDLPLVGPTWTVTSIIAGDAVSSIPDGAAATLKFLPDGKIELNTGCNLGGGSYAVEGDRISFDAIVTTKRACDGPGGAMEGAVMAVLGSDVLTWQIDASSLTIMAKGQGLSLSGK
jgi:heat shock protein HslJ